MTGHKKLRVAAAVLSAVIVAVSLTGCGGGKTKGLKKAYTDPKLKYSLEELNEKSSEKTPAYDYSVPSLYKYFENRLKIGVAFGRNQIYDYDDNLTKIAIKHFNVYVAENEMKPANINYGEGVYNFDAADAFVEFGADGSQLRGHTLVWNQQVPDWWFKADPNDQRSLKELRKADALASSEQLIERMSEYISTVVGRYKGKIKYWDVCNEVLTDDGIRRVADKSYWADIIGDLDGDGYYDDYVELAFKLAAEADPDAILIINDYYMEWDTHKVELMYEMVERMMRKGVRIDGVGFQAHIGFDIDVELFRQNLQRMSQLSAVYDECFPDKKGNFRLQVTELDMNMLVGENADVKFKKWTKEEFNAQADKFEELFDMFLDFADEGILDMVVFWGTDDESSWLNTAGNKMRTNAGLIIDRDLTPKPCFWSIARTSFK